MAKILFYILIFPGFLFLSVAGLVVEYIDRILYARFQNRQGPPWFQPVADFIKLLAKESIIPEEAEPKLFSALPVVALTAVVTAIFYVPMWRSQALFSFEGDLVVVIYLLTLPTITFFLAGWTSTSLYSMIGSVRTLTQLFAYEVPLFMGVLAPTILAETWSLSGLTKYYGAHPWYILFNIPGFVVSLIAIQGKLEKVPFDIPEAETEIVGGTFTEYSGRLLAYFRMAIDIEMVVCASLLAAIFLPFNMDLNPIAGLGLYLVKVVFMVFLFALIRSLFARLRIDQMVSFCWKYLAPLALFQLALNFILKGLLK
jgi:NADH-quinone oxidoreductase subunit H